MNEAVAALVRSQVILERTLRYGAGIGTLRPDLDCNAIVWETNAVNDGFQLQRGLSGGTGTCPAPPPPPAATSTSRLAPSPSTGKGWKTN